MDQRSIQLAHESEHEARVEPMGDGIASVDSRDRLRVLLLADHLGHSDGRVHGGTTYFLNAIPAMVRSGLDVTVCFLHGYHPMAERLETDGIQPRFLGLGKWNPRALWAIEPILRECDPHVLHLHSFKSHLAGRQWARWTHTPAVVHVHDHNVLPAPLHALLRSQASATAALVGVTRAVTEFARESYGVEPARCYTVRHGMDQRPFLRLPADTRGAVREELGIPADAPVLGVVGRLAEVKGQDLLLRIMPDILEEIPNAMLLIVGAGPTEPTLRALATELELDRHVVFTGQRDDIPAINQALDVSVMPSTWSEPFGLTALEAMLSGRPVVAFDSGGVRELIENGRTGYLVEHFDLPNLTRRIVHLLHDSDVRGAIGDAARRHAMQFTLERHVAQMTEIFRSVSRFRRAA